MFINENINMSIFTYIQYKNEYQNHNSFEYKVVLGNKRQLNTSNKPKIHVK